jgi:hypothetical protein
VKPGCDDLGNLPRAPDGIGLRHHGCCDHDHQGEGDKAAPADHGTADDVWEEKHHGDEGGEPGQLSGSTQRGDDVAEQPASEDQLNGKDRQAYR